VTAYIPSDVHFCPHIFVVIIAIDSHFLLYTAYPAISRTRTKPKRDETNTAFQSIYNRALDLCRQIDFGNIQEELQTVASSSNTPRPWAESLLQPEYVPEG
jgi:hypothetical protein